jgi:hypothetical protein
MNKGVSVQIGNDTFQIDAICRSKYMKSKDENRESVVTALHVWMVDGKDFTVFNQTADLLWDAICSTCLVLS